MMVDDDDDDDDSITFIIIFVLAIRQMCMYVCSMSLNAGHSEALRNKENHVKIKEHLWPQRHFPQAKPRPVVTKNTPLARNILPV